MNSDYLYYIALNAIPAVGPVFAKNLIRHCGSAEAIFKEKKSNLLKIPGIGEKLVQNILNKEFLDQALKQLKLCKKLQIDLLSYQDEAYPLRLKHYKDAPVLLYTKGNIDFNAQRTLAVVGTRNADEYGIEQTEKLIRDLSKYGVQIISGMAYGIDITAHRTALTEGLSTLGILGHGLDMLYPAQHKKVAEKMQQSGGLVSEFAIGKGPEREHFPMRNRLIAGMSDVLVIIQSRKKGGSMITADLAFGYNKDIFALPGRVDDEFSEGCNLLIKSQKAALIQSADDIALAMMWEKKENQKNRTTQRSLFVSLTESQKKIYALFSKNKKLSIDEISYALGIKGSELAGDLLEMELQGIVKTLPGNRIKII